MTLIPTLAERIARARADLRMGLPVVLDGTNSSAVFIPAETLTSERMATLRSLGKPTLAITDRRAATLKARAYDTDLARIVLPADADAEWVRAVADPAADLLSPLKGPFRTLREGDADLHRLALRLTKSARLLPAALVLTPAPDATDLTHLPAKDISNALSDASPLHDIIAARVPMAAGGGRVHVFRPEDCGEEHYAVEIGRPDRSKPILVRLHSACFTGDVLGSLKCDCGAQLQGALTRMGAEGSGILLYLNQEGRGIGLANKMRAYSLQDQGFDTVEANHRLGFEDDERDFRTGAQILRSLGITRIRLLTNNPAKVAMMEGCGIEVVERVPLAVGKTDQNAEYLDVKARKSGHIL